MTIDALSYCSSWTLSLEIVNCSPHYCYLWLCDARHGPRSWSVRTVRVGIPISDLNLLG